MQSIYLYYSLRRFFRASLDDEENYKVNGRHAEKVTGINNILIARRQSEARV